MENVYESRKGLSQNETGLYSLLLFCMQWFMTLTMTSYMLQRMFRGSGALVVIPLCELKFKIFLSSQAGLN